MHISQVTSILVGEIDNLATITSYLEYRLRCIESHSEEYRYLRGVLAKILERFEQIKIIIPEMEIELRGRENNPLLEIYKLEVDKYLKIIWEMDIKSEEISYLHSSSERIISDGHFAKRRYGVRIIDDPPKIVYKYCKFQDFENFTTRGIFRFGSVHFYRSQYEEGAGYGDNLDGVQRSAPVNWYGNTNLTSSISSSNYLFCVSKSYSQEVHEIWKNRKDCLYDCCLAFYSEPLFDQLIRAVKSKKKDRGTINLGSCIYMQNSAMDPKLPKSIGTNDLIKHQTFSFEDEYRMSVSMLGERLQTPLDVKIDDVGACLHLVITPWQKIAP